MKDFRFRTLITFFALFLIFPIALFTAQKPELTDRHRKWIEEEVVYIITPAEKEVFYKLKTERERARFIDVFWEQRDPSPGTPRNEFREEHYQRIDFVNRMFGKGTPIEGWQTDRGKFYIMLGRPANVEKYVTIDTYPIEIWYYHGNPKLGQEPFFRLLFFQRMGMGAFELYDPIKDGPKSLVPFHNRDIQFTIREEDREHWEVELIQFAHKLDERDIHAYRILKWNVGFELADASFSNIPGQRGPELRLPSAILIGDVQTYPQKKVRDDYAYEFLEHKAVVKVDYSVYYIRNLSRVSVFKNPSGIFFVHFVIEPEVLSVDFYQNKYFSNLKTTLRVTTPEGKTVFQSERNVPMELKKEELKIIERHHFHLSDFFPLVPGEYLFNLLLENTVSKEFASLEKKILIPEPDILRMSSLVLARKVKKSAPSDQDMRAYQVGNYNIYPTIRNIFSKKATMYLFFQIYGLTQDLRRDGILKLAICRDDEVLYTLKRKVDAYEGCPDILEKISLGELLPGGYTAKVSLQDKEGEVLLTESEEFQVRSGPLPGIWMSAQTSPPEDDPFYAHILGNQFLNKGEMEQAEEALKKAHEGNPESLEYALSYGRALLILKDHKKVRDVLTPFVEAKEEKFELFYYLGEASKGGGQYEEAIVYYQKVLNQKGDVVEILNSIGSCYLELGNKEEALRAWEKSLEINPDQEQIRKATKELKKN